DLRPARPRFQAAGPRVAVFGPPLPAAHVGREGALAGGRGKHDRAAAAAVATVRATARHIRLTAEGDGTAATVAGTDLDGRGIDEGTVGGVPGRRHVRRGRDV